MKQRRCIKPRAMLALPVVVAGGCSASLPAYYGPDATLAHGTTPPESASNGLPFAGPDAVVEDIETAGPIEVRVIRSHTDWETGVTRLLVTDETLTLSPGSISDDLANITLTLDGETLVFSGNQARAANGQADWGAYLDTAGLVSITGGVFSYSRGGLSNVAGEFDSEAFFAAGLQTDPAEIVLLTDSVEYNGEFRGWGQVLSPSTNAVIVTESLATGTIALTADFGSGTVDGGLTGTFGYDETAFDATFSSPIDGNGYAASLDTFDCTAASCTSRSGIGGVFYGADALETSGVLGLDVTVQPDGGRTYRFVSGGGFTATQ